ncbi:rhodanese-like domain-containing protein [Tenacibaculum sp. S7007]|uniref:Rhodanese-like domain-containing protein n=1 Tax=Tenacibaculum pelagium TaxID=2759527 RepID=A0A839ALS8_9FLAO|nr:rhodanese-like domain-containing protein [Tenacibaculum pelagium]MBA6156045.1 rhodanese-like domain-containing protein [Tenacibaculum pelagium]
MKKIVLLLVLAVTTISSCKPKNEGVVDVTVEDLEVVLNNDKNVQLIDVRTPSEWVDGIIDNAIKINVTADDFEKLALEKLDKSNPVYIYCRSGGRSKIAADVLLKNGFQPYNVLGGYMAWEEKNK